ncbi:unnamed protein product, partial [Didymodactylos carnosus]
NGWVRVKNKGGYVARFFVDFHTVTNNIHNNQPLRTNLFLQTFSSGDYPIRRSRLIELPPDAMDARVRVERFIFIPFGGWFWKEIFRHEFDSEQPICFDIWGTTVRPRWTTVNC